VPQRRRRIDPCRAPRQSIHLSLPKDGNFVANLLLMQQLLFLPFNWITQNRKLSEIG